MNMRKKTNKSKEHHVFNIGPAVAALKRLREERESRGEFPAEFMRLSLTSDAFEIVKGMSNAEFREFVSTAIRKAAKRRSPPIPSPR